MERRTNELNQAAAIQFDVLPDDVLLDIFDFYVNSSPYGNEEGWQTLVHVCQRWRGLVFRSPRRLKLRLLCTPETCTRDTLDVWPALPLIVWSEDITSGMDNIIAALENNNRVCEVDLDDLFAGRQFGQVWAAMQVSFPNLTHLQLLSDDDTTPAIPDSFLGGSAPHLLHFIMSGIPFPRLPNLLLTTAHLVKLSLTSIPHSGYIPPEVMVASLSALSRLEKLYLEFEPPRVRETRQPPPTKRSILPALQKFYFFGNPDYLEDLVSHIDTPRLDYFCIHFDLINFESSDLRHLTHFINRTPKHGNCYKANVQFDEFHTSIDFEALQISIECEHGQLLSSGVQACSFSIPSAVEDLYIERRPPYIYWNNDAMENQNPLWLQLLLPFTATKNLYIDYEFTLGIATALQELVGDRITGVMPCLQNIFVEDVESFKKNIEQFVVARQLAGHPIAISDWDKHLDEDSETGIDVIQPKHEENFLLLNSPRLPFHHIS